MNKEEMNLSPRFDFRNNSKSSNRSENRPLISEAIWFTKRRRGISFFVSSCWHRYTLSKRTSYNKIRDNF